MHLFLHPLRGQSGPEFYVGLLKHLGLLRIPRYTPCVAVHRTQVQAYPGQEKKTPPKPEFAVDG